MVFVNSVDGNRWHSVAIVYALNPVRRESKEAIVGADPYLALAVLVNGSHKVIQQAVLSQRKNETHRSYSGSVHRLQLQSTERRHL